MKTVAPELLIQAHIGQAACLSISDEGFRAATAGEDGYLNIWNIFDGRRIGRIAARMPVLSACYLYDDTTVAALLDSGKIRYYELSGHLIREVDAGPISIGDVRGFRRLSRTNNMVVFAGNNDEGSFVRTSRSNVPYSSGLWWNNVYAKHHSNVEGFAKSEDGAWVIAGYSSNELSVVDFKSQELPPRKLCVFGEFGDSLSALCMRGDDLLICGHGDGNLSVWDFNQLRHNPIYKMLDSLDDDPTEGDGIDEDTIDRDLPSGYDQIKDANIRILKGHEHSTMIMTAEHNRLVSHDGSGETLFWDIDTGKCVAQFNARELGGFTDMAISGSKVVTISYSGALCVFGNEP
jgi:WD40 repeat protein